MNKIRKVLLIDDDDIVNFLNKTIMEKVGFAEQIIVECEVDNAIRMLEQNHHDGLPDVIFVDVNMPEMNGWEFVELFRTISFEPSPPKIVVLTSSLDPIDEQRTMQYEEVIDFMSKLLSKEKLTHLYNKL